MFSSFAGTGNGMASQSRDDEQGWERDGVGFLDLTKNR